MAIGFLTELVPVDHPRFRQVESGIFVRRIVGNCLGYTCRVREPTKILLDACCHDVATFPSLLLTGTYN